jgi:hypothetical protein
VPQFTQFLYLLVIVAILTDDPCLEHELLLLDLLLLPDLLLLDEELELLEPSLQLSQ